MPAHRSRRDLLLPMGSITTPSAPGAQKANKGKLLRLVRFAADIDAVEIVIATFEGCAPGVNIAGAKLQVAPTGKFEHDSDTESEAPVCVKASETCADCPRVTSAEEGVAVMVTSLPVAVAGGLEIVILAAPDMWLRKEGLATAFTYSE
jgi:hypothetical protein